MNWVITGITALPLLAAQEAAQTASDAAESVTEPVIDAIETTRRAAILAFGIWLVTLYLRA